ncbi:MAG TPA: long-chain fatty acid--CoA ligase, partial [Usitatibacter sp.]|nr:long-chain fatty acid--CoA ligase [Usitatibacter sp.]
MDPAWVGDIPASWAAAEPGRLALMDESGSHSWQELDEGRRAWAARLRELGVRAGDRVMVVGENAPAMAMLVFAVTTLRAWIVNVNARLSAREVRTIREHCRARRVIYLAGISPDARAHAAADAAAVPLDGGRWGEMAISALEQAAEPEPMDGDPARDVAALLYTTGTTGHPKAVMLTHASLLFIARAARDLRAITPRDRVLALLPLTHVYGLASVCLGSLLGGASLHFQARFAPAAAVAFIREQRLTVCQGVPAMYAKLLQHLRAAGEAAFAAPALRFLYAGGSPLALELKRDVEAFFGLTLHNGYGLTEASPTLTQTRHEAPRDDCSVGPALPGVELRIVDGAGRDLPDGDVGELWARGPNVMKGYYRD